MKYGVVQFKIEANEYNRIVSENAHDSVSSFNKNKDIIFKTPTRVISIENGTRESNKNHFYSTSSTTGFPVPIELEELSRNTYKMKAYSNGVNWVDFEEYLQEVITVDESGFNLVTHIDGVEIKIGNNPESNNFLFFNNYSTDTHHQPISCSIQ